jgi:hypothetical protein
MRRGTRALMESAWAREERQIRVYSRALVITNGQRHEI